MSLKRKAPKRNRQTVREWSPKCRAAVFSDRRLKRRRTRGEEQRKAISESV